MKLRITDTEEEFRVEVTDDADCVIVDESTGELLKHCPYEFPTHFKHKGEWYAILPPVCGAKSGDWRWHICKLQPQPVTPVTIATHTGYYLPVRRGAKTRARRKQR